MNTLRWILLIIGIVLVAGIYWSSRRGENRLRQRKEPAFDGIAKPIEADPEQDEILQEADDPDLAPLETAESDIEESIFDFEHLLAEEPERPSAPVKKPVASKQSVTGTQLSMLLDGELVVIHALMPDSLTVPGEQLYHLLQELWFELGDDSIFYYSQDEYPIMLVNAFKPGVFPPDPMEFESKGISLILRLSKARKPVDAFKELISIAHDLKSSLNLQLLDVHRNSLTNQTIAFLEEEIRQYQLRV